MTGHQHLAMDAGAALRMSGKMAVFVLAILGSAWLVQDKLADVRAEDVWAAMAAIPIEACVLAFVFGLLSHLALAGYDMLALTRIGRRVPWARALSGGFSGTVMSQVLGFGLITGSLARARIYRANGIGPTEAVALSGFVAAGFFLGLGMLLAMLLLVDPSAAVAATGLASGTVRVFALTGLLTIIAASLLTRGRPRAFKLGRMTIRVPDGKWLAMATALAAADLLPAALCLAVMLPGEAIPSLAVFVSIYITGVALGHMIGSPGAAGPFEGIIFLALPAIGAEELAAGILMYRLVYYLPPFAMALWMIARTPGAPRVALLSGDALRDRVDWIMDETPQAEAELVHLGDKHVYCPADGEGFVFYGISGRVWLVIGEPVGPRRAWDDLIEGLEAEAHAAGAVLAIYKANDSARTFWLDRGYHLQPLGQEAVIDLSDWSLDGSARRELRRKCRSAGKAGLSLARHLPGTHPGAEMAEVAEAWRAMKGGEQSFSMGHWQPGFNARHMAVSAWHQNRLIAFATVWTSGDGTEWMLDLMRQLPEVPNGAMHALLVEAIEMAKEAGAQRFNLCMAPLSGLEQADPVTRLSRAAHRVYADMNHRHGLQGMQRFKDIFRPEWMTRHVAVPKMLLLPEALLASYLLVHRQAAPAESTSLRTPWMRPLGAGNMQEFADLEEEPASGETTKEAGERAA